jgi:hypothetical protein
MESEPNRFDDFLKRQRDLSPPPHLAANLERNVMRRVLNMRSARPYLRVRWAAVSLLASLIIAMSILLLHPASHSASAKTHHDFQESVVILEDGHVCIWLEPQGNSLRGTVP